MKYVALFTSPIWLPIVMLVAAGIACLICCIGMAIHFKKGWE